MKTILLLHLFVFFHGLKGFIYDYDGEEDDDYNDEEDGAFVSSKCVNSSCSTHHLSCRTRERILLFGAKNVFLPGNHLCHSQDPCQNIRYGGRCCGTINICKQSATKTDLAILSRKCNGLSSCNVDARFRNLNSSSCSGRNWGSVFSSEIKYSCVPEYSILTSIRHTNIRHARRASLLLNNSKSSPLPAHRGRCSVSAFYEHSLHVYSYAIHSVQHSWRITVTDSERRTYVFNSSQPTFEMSSVAHRVATMSPPLTVDIHMEHHPLPAMVWIGFVADEGNSITMGCDLVRLYDNTVPASSTTSYHPNTTSRHDVTTTSYPNKTTHWPWFWYLTTSPRRFNVTSWPYVTTRSHNSNTTRVWPWTSPPWRHPDTTSHPHVTGRRDSTPYMSGGNGTAAMMNQRKGESHDDSSDTGLVVGVVMAILMVVTGIVIAAVVLYRRRSQWRKDNPKLQGGSTLPVPQRVDDSGYCVPVTTVPGVPPPVWNPGYRGQNQDNKPANSITESRDDTVAIDRTNPAFVADKESKAGYGSGAGEGDPVYEYINKGTEDDESGIDAESYDSEFDGEDTPDDRPARGPVYGNTHCVMSSEGDFARYPDNEQIYHELEAEYHNANQATHYPHTSQYAVSDLARLNQPGQSNPPRPSGAAEAEGVSGCPSYPLPRQPDTGVVNKMKQGAKDIGVKLKSWLPRRQKLNLTEQEQANVKGHGPVRVSDLQIHGSALSHAATAPYASVTLPLKHDAVPMAPRSSLETSSQSKNAASTSGHDGSFSPRDRKSQHRRLPHIPNSAVISTLSGNISENGDPDFNEDDSTGIYHLAKPVEEDQDEEAASASASITLSLEPSKDLDRRSSECKQGNRSRQDYENQTPAGIIAQFQQPAKQPQKSAGTASVATSSGAAREVGQDYSVVQKKEKNAASSVPQKSADAVVVATSSGATKAKEVSQDYSVVQKKEKNAASSVPQKSADAVAVATSSGAAREVGQDYSVVRKKEKSAAFSVQQEKPSTKPKPKVKVTAGNVAPPREDNSYNQISINQERGVVMDTNYDHLAPSYQVPPNHPSHLYCNVDINMDQAEC